MRGGRRKEREGRGNRKKYMGVRKQKNRRRGEGKIAEKGTGGDREKEG